VNTVVIVLLVLAAELVLGIVLGRFIAFGTREPRAREQRQASGEDAAHAEVDAAEPATVETDTDKP
jgi:hypothetical protein